MLYIGIFTTTYSFTIAYHHTAFCSVTFLFPIDFIKKFEYNIIVNLFKYQFE